jgi:hypothetical protein
MVAEADNNIFLFSGFYEGEQKVLEKPEKSDQNILQKLGIPTPDDAHRLIYGRDPKPRRLLRSISVWRSTELEEYVGGLGRGDVSLDRGILGQGPLLLNQPCITQYFDPKAEKIATEKSSIKALYYREGPLSIQSISGKMTESLKAVETGVNEIAAGRVQAAVQLLTRSQS